MWPMPWHLWQQISIDVRPVEATEEDFLAGAGGNTMLLPGARAEGAVVAGREIVEGGSVAG